MIRQFELPQFLRYLKICPSGQMSFFLGSGASVQAGIPTGSTFVWEFKKEIYCSVTGTSQERFRDLQSESNQKLLQNFFDAEGSNPKLYDPSEYSHYFEKCYPLSPSREQFITKLVSNKNPSLGHICLGNFIINGKVKNVWTTNFDGLIEAGIFYHSPAFSFRILSSVNKDSLSKKNNLDLPNIYKLHGDFRYDNIKNTLQEVKSLELAMNNELESSLTIGGLVMIGYSGCDESIMSIFERNVSNTNFFPNGLVWLKHKNSKLPERTIKLMEQICTTNMNSGIVEIDGFDEFMFEFYLFYDGNNQLINEKWRDFPNRCLPITFSASKADYFIKLNTFESLVYPIPYSFDTDICTWKELRDFLGENKIIAALYTRKIYCFASLENINKIFKKHILSEPREDNIPLKIFYREDSFYIGMLYELIKFSLESNKNIISFGKNKFYDLSKHEIFNDNYTQYNVYDGIEFFLEFINGKYYLMILLTVFITDRNGNPVSTENKKLLINKKISNIYNNIYDEKIQYWNRIIRTKGSTIIEFSHEGFSINFNHACVTYGKMLDSANYPQKIAHQFDEPVITFNVNNPNAKGINQLKGVSIYGPIDFSYAKQDQARHAIKLSIISPINDMQKLLNHLNKLKQGSSLQKDDGFTPVYNGFESIYRQSIDIPQSTDNTRCFGYDGSKITTREELVNILKRRIDFFSIEAYDFSLLVIYIPKIFEKFRMGNHEEDFNLHDAIKLYAMKKTIKVQFIEEKSLNYYEPCKVMWALSTSIYAKQGGILWRPETLDTETAFVGVSYSLSKEKRISVGCSQLFDASGTGLRLLLRRINDPHFIKKNPFMKADEARQMMSILREQYYSSFPTSTLNRIVIHKTTFFTHEEIKGFTQALEGIEDIELLQIQEYSPWRGIRFRDIDVNNGVDKFSMKRGTAIVLSENEYLLWTHGCVINNELFNGKGYNYYKGSRGIPMPLKIRRFYGKATGDVLTKEIMMLTKMNWNSGDSLYKHLPVTIDFAKILSRMAKQNEALYDQLYDFRFFM
jgi:NAD-dependent SIR2 family protein deacetylase